MTQVTVNGHVYSDDGSAARDMLNGGAKTWHFPMIVDTMVEVAAASVAKSAAEAAAASAAASAAAASAVLAGTSATSVLMGTGAKTFVTQAGKQFAPGTYLRIQRAADAAVYMYGRSTAYDATDGNPLSVNVERIQGAGTFTDWQIFVTSREGDVGPAGTPTVGYRTITSADTVGVGDAFKLLRCSGSFTLGFSAGAMLGAKFAVFVQNRGSGIITLAPNGAELIEGAGTKLLHPGQELLISWDGTTFNVMQLNAGAANKMIVQDQKASGTAGAALTAGTLANTREINTVVSNTIEGASLASNTITLPAGTYDISGWASTGGLANQRVFLYNSADATYLIASGQSSDSRGSMGISGRVAILVSKTFTVRHYSNNAVAAGAAASIAGQQEFYLNLEITKVA